MNTSTPVSLHLKWTLQYFFMFTFKYLQVSRILLGYHAKYNKIKQYNTK